MAVLTSTGQLDDRRQPTTTLEGWRRFAQAETSPQFELLPNREWKSLKDLRRVEYDEARIAHHAELVVVTTSAITEITNEGRLLTLLNQREIGARRGLIISGPAATGKTTALKQLGRLHELRTRTRFPRSERIPVVYVTAPPKGSPRKLTMEFARFLGLATVRSRHNTTDIAGAVCNVLIDACTDIVIIDEIHNISLTTRAGEDMSDHLKYFTEHLPATFLYAGIDLERSGLFTGVRGRQLAGRCQVINTTPFPYDAQWQQLVGAMEAPLRLHHHTPNQLVDQAEYLHHRTGGMIGSLGHLVRASAIRAILDGSEKINRALMDKIHIDHAAESLARRAGVIH
ncbi:AAA family ATPase [Nocardia uniformis]|uniref:AAA family ATPase n=1 Tax=Nocardia uniformis TaxID=53432 RepID=A0A849CAG7_9NOCA|nr:ATP-binding protein [Nocardia uniformis]NNH75833.1 AAA family ATPase [Nocardia uniformis]